MDATPKEEKVKHPKRRYVASSYLLKPDPESFDNQPCINSQFSAKYKKSLETFRKTWSKYKGNKIRTTKYTLLSFLPKNLFEQFHRLANFYFLILIGLNFIPEVNAFAKEVSMLPLLAVLIMQGFKDAWEDFSRYKLDKAINSSMSSTCG